MRLFLYAIPVLYAGLFIVFPVYFFKLSYFWSVIAMFWAPSVILYAVLLPLYFLKNPAAHKAFWILFGLMIPLTTAFEYFVLWLDLWNFSEQVSRLIGLRIFGAPVEEFLFWYGATPFCLLVYLYYKRLPQNG